VATSGSDARCTHLSFQSWASKRPTSYIEHGGGTRNMRRRLLAADDQRYNNAKPTRYR